MNGDSSAACDITRDRIPGNRVAAARKTYKVPSLALDKNAVTGLLALPPTRSFQLREHLRHLRRRTVLDRLLMQLNELRHDAAQGHTAIAECSEQIILGLHIKFLCNLSETLLRSQFLGRVAETLCLVTDEAHPALDILLTVLFLEPRAYLSACSRRCNRIQPVGARTVACLIGYDGDNISILELVFERDNLSVDLCSYAVMPDLRVDMIGEINRIRSLRQINNVTARCKDKNLIGEHIQLKGFKELLRIVIFLLQTDHLTEPRHFLIILIRHADASPSLFILPMRRHAEFRNPMHRFCANLDLKRISARHDRRVQRLVPV